MRTGLIIATLVCIAVVVLIVSWSSAGIDRTESGYKSEFVLGAVHDDGSVDWALLVPFETARAMGGNRKVADVTAEVLELAGRGFDKHHLNARGCVVTDVSKQLDGTVRYDGHCAWTDAPHGQHI